jgi:hypothetical protein
MLACERSNLDACATIFMNGALRLFTRGIHDDHPKQSEVTCMDLLCVKEEEKKRREKKVGNRRDKKIKSKKNEVREDETTVPVINDE